MNISDETVSAYADGELSRAQRKQFENQPVTELDLKIRVKKIRRLDALLKQAFPLEDKIPERFLKTISGPAGQIEKAANVIPISGRGRKHKARLGYWKPASLAASVTLMIGAITGSLLLTDNRPVGPALASGIKPGAEFRPGSELHGALEHTLSANSVRLAENGHTVTFEPVLSFKSTNGNYCREFDLHYEFKSLTGLACRADAASWRLEAAVAGPETGQGNGYQLASGQDSEALNAAVDNLMADAPLSKEEERRLIARQWQPES